MQPVPNVAMPAAQVAAPSSGSFLGRCVNTLVAKVSRCAAAVLGSVIGFVSGNVLVPTHVEYDFTAARTKLQRLTRSPLCGRVCQLLAQFGARYLNHYLLQAEEVDLSVQEKWVKERFLSSEATGKSQYSFLGNVAHAALSRRQTLITETLEANILNILTNLVESIQALQHTNPAAPVRWVQSVADICSQMLHHASRTAVEPGEINGEAFAQYFAGKILKYSLPNGASDIVVPKLRLPGRVCSNISNELFQLTEKVILPEIFVLLYSLVTSDAMKDKMCLSLITELRKKMSGISQAQGGGGRSLFRPCASPIDAPPGFAQSLVSVVTELLKYLSPSLQQLGSLVNIENKVTENAPLLASYVASIDGTECLNRVFEAIIPCLEESLGQTSQPFCRTLEEQERQRQDERRKQESMRVQLNTALQGLLDEFHEYVSSTATQKQTEILQQLQHDLTCAKGIDELRIRLGIAWNILIKALIQVVGMLIMVITNWQEQSKQLIRAALKTPSHRIAALFCRQLAAAAA